MDVSVVICTRNRAESLEKTLRALSAVVAPEGFSWEIVVVDNGSSDATRDVIEAFRTASGLSVTYVSEPRPGLSHARNRGLSEAKGTVVAFTDDDIIVDGSWLREVVEECRRNADAAMIFGQTRRYARDTPYLSIREDWTRQRFAFPCNPWSVGHGNNMILRKDLAAAVGTFDPRLGAGTRIGSAEDTDYVYRVLKSGREVLFAPSVVVYHDHDRISEDTFREIDRNYAKGRGALYCKHILGGDDWAGRLLYRELRVLAGMAVEGKEKRRKAAFHAMGLVHGAATWVLLEMRRGIDFLAGKGEAGSFRRTGP